MTGAWWVPTNVAMIFGAAMSVWLAVLAWPQSVPGGRWFSFMVLAMAECEGFWAAENLSTGMSTKIEWAKLEYFGIATTPLLAFLFIRTYCGRRQSRIGRALLWCVPNVIIVLALTNEHHRLVWSSIVPSSHDPGAPLVYTLGTAGRLLVLFNYTLLVLTIFAVFQWARHAQHMYRRQALVAIAGITIPFAGSALYTLKWVPAPFGDLLPLSITVSAALVYLAIFRFRFLDLIPIARATLVESMVDGLLVVDSRQRVVDSNPAAQRLLSSNARQLTGENMADLLGQAPCICRALDATQSVTFEMRAPSDERLHLEVQAIPLRVRRSEGGRLFVFRDITAKWHVEEELRAQLQRNMALQQELREEAIRDSLTGTFNRRLFQEALIREVARAQRERVSMGLIVIDLDNFKAVNDRHGHQAGDRVLQAVSALLQSETRSGDVVCRYGGEEFVVVMPGATAGAACRRAEQWRRDVESMCVDYEGAILHVTFSAGVSAYPASANNADEVLRAADHALFEAKRAGRNNVCMAASQELVSV